MSKLGEGSDSTSMSEDEVLDQDLSQEETVVEVPPKRKRQLTEKQKACLERGRAKKLALNQANKENRVKVPRRKVKKDEGVEETKASEQPNLEVIPDPPKLQRQRKTHPSKPVPVPPPSPEVTTEESEEESPLPTKPKQRNPQQQVQQQQPYHYIPMFL